MCLKHNEKLLDRLQGRAVRMAESLLEKSERSGGVSRLEGVEGRSSGWCSGRFVCCVGMCGEGEGGVGEVGVGPGQVGVGGGGRDGGVSVWSWGHCIVNYFGAEKAHWRCSSTSTHSTFV